MVELEEKYIDKMFEMGDIEGIKAVDLKQFIKKRTNEKLVELGYVDLGTYFAYDAKAAANLDWFYHLTGGSLILIFSRLGRRITQKQTKVKTSKTYGSKEKVT